MTHPRRRILLALLVLLAAALLVARPVHERILALFDAATPVIQEHAVLGPVVFVLLSALSAALAFFSSALFVPVAVNVWGPALTAVLLWLGWWIGGAGAYTLGRYVGDPIVRRLIGGTSVDRYEGWIRERVSVGRITLLHMAVPSEAASYLLGMSRAPWPIFLAGIGVAQVPFAVLSVLLGGSFLERKIGMLALLWGTSLLVSAIALRTLHRGDPLPALPVEHGEVLPPGAH